MDLSNKIIIKARNGSEIRKMALHSDELSLHDLLLMLQRVFQLQTQDFSLKYTDEDGDRVSIVDENDLQFALAQSRVLKLIIISTDRLSEDSLSVEDMIAELADIHDRSATLIRHLENLGVDRGRLPSSEPQTPRSHSKPAAYRPPDVVADGREFDPLSGSNRVAAVTNGNTGDTSRSATPNSSVTGAASSVSKVVEPPTPTPTQPEPPIMIPSPQQHVPEPVPHTQPPTSMPYAPPPVPTSYPQQQQTYYQPQPQTMPPAQQHIPNAPTPTQHQMQQQNMYAQQMQQPQQPYSQAIVQNAAPTMTVPAPVQHQPQQQHPQPPRPSVATPVSVMPPPPKMASQQGAPNPYGMMPQQPQQAPPVNYAMNYGQYQQQQMPDAQQQHQQPPPSMTSATPPPPPVMAAPQGHPGVNPFSRAGGPRAAYPSAH